LYIWKFKSIHLLHFCQLFHENTLWAARQHDVSTEQDGFG